MAHIPQIDKYSDYPGYPLTIAKRGNMKAIELIKQIKNPYDKISLDYDEGMFLTAQHAAFEVARDMTIATLQTHES